MPKRKTYTSPQVKDRWNKKHYDRVAFHCPKGAKDLMKEIAKEKGLTFAEYMRRLVLEDAQKSGKTALIEALGGGGYNSPCS